jgi:hypothetical protein
MRSHVDVSVRVGSPVAESGERAARVVGATLHALAFGCMALLLWRSLSPDTARRSLVSVDVRGQLDVPLSTLIVTASDTMDVRLQSAPDGRARAALRALRSSGHALRLSSDHALIPVAVSAEAEWRASGGSHVQAVGVDSVAAVISDAAGVIDSTMFAHTGLQSRTGPVQGVLHVDAQSVRAAVAPLFAGSPQTARVLVLGNATWESRFLITALEESGWPVDAAVSLSPKVTVAQGPTRVPNRDRHSIVVVLPGTSASAMAALPEFVRRGGGLVIVGAAARSGALSSLRAGTPGGTLAGEVGAESGTEPRHALDLIPIAELADGGVTLELRDSRITIAARRVGAGRVVQVGYDNSWLWRMGGNDDSPIAHRRWWTAILSGVVPQTAPASTMRLDPEHDTLSAAPIAALARDVGLPVVRASSVDTLSQSFIASLNPRWLLWLAVLSLVMSWMLRRWRGLV